jgi:hypothetical protein
MRIEILMGALLAGSCSAVFAEKLPKLNLTVQADVCLYQGAGGDKAIHKFGTVSKTVRLQGAMEHATATASPGPVSTVSASATGKKAASTLCSPDLGAVTNDVTFEVVGPPGNVRVDYSSTGAVTHTGVQGYARVHAMFTIFGQYAACIGDADFCANYGFTEGDNFDVDGTVVLQANTEYSLTLESVANAVSSDYDGTLTSTVTGGISVNPADAGAYHIKYGKGFVPE